jgi:transcription elongation factor Elf1
MSSFPLTFIFFKMVQTTSQLFVCWFCGHVEAYVSPCSVGHKNKHNRI